MYIDPPYPNNKCNYAHNMRGWEEHITLANKLKDSKCKWALSSYDNENIRNLFKDFNIIPLQAFSGMKVKKTETKRVINMEVLITNYYPKNDNLIDTRIDNLSQVSLNI